MSTVLIAGSSIAGLSAARELRRSGYDGHIVTIDRDVHTPYRRPEVSKGLLSGALAYERVALGWSEDLRTERISGAELTGIDLVGRSVHVHDVDGRDFEQRYDDLIIATGTRSRPSPFPPITGVHSLRTAADAEVMKSELVHAQNVVIVGGGFIGLEVAAVAAKLGKHVRVIEPMAAPLVHILGPTFSAALLQRHVSEGVEFILGQTVGSLDSDAGGRISGVTLSGGDTLRADIVLVAIGSVPDTAWLRESGLDVDRGLICDETCAVVGAERVVAAGDIALWHNPLYDRLMRVEHWTNAIEQGTYAAKRVLGVHDPDGFISAPYFWSDQYGSRIQSIGSNLGHDEVMILDDDPATMFVAYLKDGRLLSVAGMKAGAAIFQFRDLVLRGADAVDITHHFESLQKAA